jgi:hypothetical protein
MAACFRDDFERGMIQLAEKNSHAMPVLQRAMAAFFFKFVPTTSNLYFQLAQRIRARRWRGAICTLNYERLLELSLLGSGVQPVVGQPLDAGHVELCLPHGCCHIFCDGAQASAEGVSFSGADVTFDGPIKVLSDPVQFQARISGDAVPPVMSYFDPQKTTSAGASFISGQRDRWAALAAQADVIAIVGVKVRPHDGHIWSPVADSRAEVVYCAGSAAGAEFREWAASSRPRKSSRVLTGYFAQEFETVCHAVGLA